MKEQVLIGLFAALTIAAGAENFRASVAGRLELDAAAPQGTTRTLTYIDSAIIELTGGLRFIRGVELELRIPQSYLKYRGSLAMAVYTGLSPIPSLGVVDLYGERLLFEQLPNKLQAVYQIPLRKDHGLKASPYVTITAVQLDQSAFPLLFRIMPVIKGLADEVEKLQFQLSIKPILSDEGALHLDLRYPDTKPDGEAIVRVDDIVVDAPTVQPLLKEGEHLLTVTSDAYRLESRRFLINRALTTEIRIDLQDTTPEVAIEAPGNALVQIDGIGVIDHHKPLRISDGVHEFRMDIGDYSLSKTITLIRGRKYRIALSLDLAVTESE